MQSGLHFKFAFHFATGDLVTWFFLNNREVGIEGVAILGNLLN